MKKRHLIKALILGTLGLVPSIGCSSAAEKTGRSSNKVEGGCIDFPETGHSVCDNERGNFKSTFEKFGLAAIGYPLTDPYPDGKGDWYQAFERVDMNGNFGKGCEQGRACVAHLGRWDIEKVQGWSIGGKVSDCTSDAVGERVNELCLPHDFLDKNYYKNGELEFYGHMLTRVYDNCPLYPNGVLGQCFWTERAKVGRIYGRDDWEGEQLGRKKLELEGTENGSPPPPPDPIATDPRMNLPETTVYLPATTPGVSSYVASKNVVSVCREGTDAALVSQLEKFLFGREWFYEHPSVIVQTGDTWETRQLREVTAYEPVSGCPYSDGFNVYLEGTSHGFLKDFNIAGSFISEFGGGKIGCEYAGFKIDQFALEVKKFELENGVLKKPAVNVTIGGEIGGVGASCSVPFKSGPLFFQAGVVPIYYELYMEVGLEISVVKPVRFQAKLAVNTSETSSFWFGDDSAAGNGFKVAPQIRLGATFYKTVSAYVGMNFPITAESRDGCTPDFWLGGEMVAGAKAGVPFGSVVQAEFTSEPFFKKRVKEGKCSGQ